MAATVESSAISFATMRSQGASTVPDAVIEESTSVSAATALYVSQHGGLPLWKSIVDSASAYYSGNPVSKADILARIDDLRDALAIITQAATDVRAAINSDSTPITWVNEPAAGRVVQKRVFS